MPAPSWWSDDPPPAIPHHAPQPVGVAASLSSSVLEDVPVPPGFLSREQQRAWQAMLRHVVFSAILDAALAPATSEDEQRALAYLRNPAHDALFEYAGLPPERLRWAVRSREAVLRSARLIRRIQRLESGAGRLRGKANERRGRA